MAVIGFDKKGAAAAVAADIPLAVSITTLAMLAPCSKTNPAIASFLFLPAICPNRFPTPAALFICVSCMNAIEEEETRQAEQTSGQ